MTPNSPMDLFQKKDFLFQTVILFMGHLVYLLDFISFTVFEFSILSSLASTKGDIKTPSPRNKKVNALTFYKTVC